MEINIPAVKLEVENVFREYETALVSNDVQTLDRLFMDAPTTIRFGGGENLFGYDEIAQFRSARSDTNLERKLERTVVTTYGTDFATASTLFYRETSPGKIGRQMQTWLRTESGWKVVAAHVSVIEDLS